MPKTITVFTRPTCGPCCSLKAYLKKKGIIYNEVNIDEEPGATARLMKLSGQAIVPMTLITRQDDSQEIISGYNLSRLVSALS